MFKLRRNTEQRGECKIESVTLLWSTVKFIRWTFRGIDPVVQVTREKDQKSNDVYCRNSC